MLNRKTITQIAKARLKDARTLLSAKRFDGAVYLCGYAIELGLKSKICETLNWQGYPESRNEFENYRSFKTHDLDVLLHLSGVEAQIKKSFLAEWSAISQWNPEARYKPIGKVKHIDAKSMLTAAGKLLKQL